MILDRALSKSIQKPGFSERAEPFLSRTLGRRCVFATAFLFALGLPAILLSADKPDAISKLDHLLQAAAHLEKAGRTDWAAEIYAQIAAEADVDRQRLADAKLEQIRQLEADIARLRTTSAAGDQIVVQLKVIELALQKLHASGLTLVSIRNLLDSKSSAAVLDEGGQISAFMELLCREGLVQVVAEPKLVTVNGRPATLQVGTVGVDGPRDDQHRSGQGAVSLAGLRFDCTPKITDSGKLSLALYLRRQMPVTAAETGAGAGDPPAVGSLELSTQVELSSGETLVLAGPRQSQGAEGSNATLLLLTATIVGTHGPLPPP